MQVSEQLATLESLSLAERRTKLLDFSDLEREELLTYWKLWARPKQLPPAGDWRLWLIMAGRGFGKTRAGAEWARDIAERNPEARIALIAASLGEARAIMVEGESGLLNICPSRRAPAFEPSLRRLTWPNGAQAFLYSAGEPESLRGPQHSHACRASAERSLRERGFGNSRRLDPLPRRRRASLPTRRPSGRRLLADRTGIHRHLG